jgi:hypothetical protein
MSDRQECCFDAERRTPALERYEETSLRHETLAISARRCETRRGCEVALYMEIVAERRQHRRDENAGYDRTTGERCERANDQRCATD